MAVVHDETFCGPLCQHPSCWQSQRRCQRGLPRSRKLSYDSDSEDEGLPTQKVVNLLDDYGEDSRDRYPAKWRGRPVHERAGSMANLTRAHTRESFPKVRAPNATPASPVRLATLSMTGVAPKPMNKVEVQEVFDLDDLQSDWHETFQAKKYYVWVPNAQKKKPRTPLDPMESVSIKQMSQGPQVLYPKDVTEDMVPEELEIQRINEWMFAGGWPDRKRKERRLDCKTPTGGQPYSYPLTQGGEYNGLYDLLDLPREVLADIVNHIEDRELKSKHQFVEAVIRTLPKLEKNHTAIALASSSVLLQRPIKLLDGDLRKSKGVVPFTTKQVYQLDDKVLDRLSTANEPPASQRNTERSVDITTQNEPPASSRSTKASPPLLNKKKPLPAIGGEAEKETEEDKEVQQIEVEDEDVTDDKRKIPSIALGLPTIPSGLRYTKTFTYNQQDFDFTLCPIPSPLQGIGNLPLDQHTPSPAPAPSPSSVVGTLPTVATAGQDAITPAQEDRQRENTQATVITDIIDSLPSTPWNYPSVTQMIVHMPKTPNATPVTRQSTYLTDGDAIFTPDPGRGLDPGMSPAPPTTPRQLTIVSQKSLALTPDTGASGLHPIAESSDAGTADSRAGQPEEIGTIRHQMPRRLPHSRSNHRSVHFAPSVPPDAPLIPPQPPSSPNESEEVSQSPLLTSWQMAQAQQNSAAYTAYARQEAEALMVIGKGTMGTGPAGSGYLQSRAGPAPGGQRPPPTGGSASSPEPWPQVDEEAYKQSLPRTPSSPPKSAKSGLSEVNLEPPNRTPDASGRGSYPTRSASTGSRESTLAAKRIWQEGQLDQLESPAPPPPSPEPRDLAASGMVGSSSGPSTANKSPTKSPASGANPLTMVAEVEESESEMTISAKPPSYFDSVSRIPSPRSLANSQQVTRDNTLVSREATGLSLAYDNNGSGSGGVLSRESTQGDLASQPHGHWAQREQEKQKRRSDQEKKQTATNLDQFDATEESLKKELEGEYAKLAK